MFVSQVKLDAAQAGKPSRVLHFRGVPNDATEGEIVQLGLPFGRMTNLVLAKKKNQVRYSWSNTLKLLRIEPNFCPNIER